MKCYSLIFSLLHILILNVQGQGSYAVISGRVLVPNLEQLPLHKLGEASIFKLNGRDQSIQLDTLGYFYRKIYLDEPLYFSVLNKRIYIRPLDSLHIEVDNDANIRYTGKHLSILNGYLKDLQTYNTGGFYDYGKFISLDVGKTIDTMINRFCKKKTELATMKKLLPNVLFKTEHNRLWCLALHSSGYITLAAEYMVKYGISQDSAENLIGKDSLRLQKLQMKAEQEIIIDEDIFALEDFTRYRKYYAQKIRDKKLSAILNEFNLAYDLNNKIIKSGDTIDLFTTRKLLRDLGVNKYRSILEENMEIVQARFEQELPPVVFSDTHNNHETIDHFKNKIIYIDLWATWCSPCIKLKPELYRMYDLYKDNENIAFLSISIDRDANIWREYLENNPSPLPEWHAGQDFVNYLQINSIPRSIIIGRDGKLIDRNAPKPDDPRLKEKLEELLRVYTPLMN